MNLVCNRCGKKLSKKRARMIDGEVLCSPCMMPPLRKGLIVDNPPS